MGTTFSPERAYRLANQVALRPEPFGALAYHYGTRRLNFLNSNDLVQVVESLDQHANARSAFESCGIDRRRWPSFASALSSLLASGFLEPVPHDHRQLVRPDAHPPPVDTPGLT